MMKPFPVIGPALVAGASLATLVVFRRRHEQEHKQLRALKAAHASLEHRAAALETKVRQLERGASELDRERDEFLATLSHELRSPLNAILGWIELLRLHLEDPAQQAHAIDVIERNAHAEVRIVSDLLDMARLVTGRLQLSRAPVALDGVVREAVSAISDAAATKGIALHVEGNDAARAVGDRARLRQVVAHLLANAIKFTPPGGRVVVRLSSDASGAVLEVADTGIGLAREMLPHVFERFRQAESGLTRPYGGLGLGLAIVRQLVELHGGSVTVDSPGLQRGATFTVRLPRESWTVTC
jgi:signal transduction histidine kinase